MTYKACIQSVVFRLFMVITALFTQSCTYNEPEEVKPEEIDVSYKEDIKPIIVANCYSCHTASSTDPEKAGYAFLDNYEELKRYALTPSTANASLTKLQARLRFIEFPGMPFKQAPLAENDILIIEAWIKAGAPNN